MSPRSLTLSVMTALALCAAGCPKPPPPPPQPEPEVRPPPAPPPKCESLSEKCSAAADTKARITNSGLVFAPPPGWTYAQLSSATLAQASDSGPALAFLGVDLDPKDAKKELAAREATLTELVKQIGLAPLKRKVNWKKPDDPKKAVGSYKADFWQFEEGGVRGQKKGPLLIVVIPVAEGKGVMGVGFVPDDDKTSADAAILKAIESLGKAP
jgi:hypothetical protein